MNKSSQHQDDQCLDDLLSPDGGKLLIQCTADGELYFFCDWSKDDAGFTCMGNILSIIEKENIVDLIIENLKKNAQSPQDKEDVNKLMGFYNTIDKIYRQEQSLDDNEVVISPLDAESYII